MVAVWYADKASKRESVSHIVRVNGDEGTPVPIPNTVVKLVYGDNTWLATAREDNSTRTSADHTLIRSTFLNSSVGRACGC